MSARHTWGSTETERRAAYPCDGLIDGPTWACFRAIDVAAGPETVYRWLCQMRVAPYSYDLIDNLGRRSPRELTPGLETVVAGDGMMTIFRVVSVQPGQELTLLLSPPPGWVGSLLGRLMVPSALTYRVSRRGPDAARIVVKYVSADPPGLRGRALRTVMPLGDLVMMRRQLMTFRSLAERDHRRERARGAGTSGG